MDDGIEQALAAEHDVLHAFYLLDLEIDAAADDGEVRSVYDLFLSGGQFIGRKSSVDLQEDRARSGEFLHDEAHAAKYAGPYFAAKMYFYIDRFLTGQKCALLSDDGLARCQLYRNDAAQDCQEKGVPFMVDASQSAGAIPIDVQKMRIDLLAFPGHKSLLGPTGTGALYVAPSVSPRPIRSGGTGVFSEVRLQPQQLPYYYEAGTPNTVGIAGLAAAAHYIMERSVSGIYHEEQQMLQSLVGRLGSIPKVTVYGPTASPRAAAASFNIEDMDCADVAMVLETYYNISVRSGLQCAPDTHRLLGTFDLGGTVRVSPGLFTSPEEIDAFLDAIREIAEEA